MQLDIAGRNIVITGAAQGLGRTLALALAADGARVAVLARDRDRAQRVVDEISAASPQAPAALALVADVSEETTVTEAAAQVEARRGRVDALINNAGWMPGNHPVLQIERSTLDRVLGSNVIGPFLVTKHFAPLMFRGGGGRIIFMSSIIGVQAGPGAAAYGGSKAALNILSNVVHLELGDQGIRTVAIAPGLTETPGMKAIVDEAHLARVAANYPGGRIGQPEDIVGLVTFLCSDASAHISGTLIAVRPPIGSAR